MSTDGGFFMEHRDKKDRKSYSNAIKNPVAVFKGHLKGIKNMDEPFAEAIIMAKKF